jgi:hypothetical protein
MKPAQVFQQFFEDYPLGVTNDLIDAAWELTVAREAGKRYISDDLKDHESFADQLTEREFLNPCKAFIPVFNYRLPKEWKEIIKGNQLHGLYAKALFDKMLSAARLISIREGNLESTLV